jgi:WD40 repeat protein
MNYIKNIPYLAVVVALYVIVNPNSTMSADTERGELPEESRSVKEVWTFELPEPLKARIYQAAVIPNMVPVVIASTIDDILRIEPDLSRKGKALSTSLLREHGKSGERLLLPSPTITTSLLETPVGFIVHKHNVIASLRIVTLEGTNLAKVVDQRHFHYRLAPDGNSFVGIDAGGKPGGFSAESVIYRFFSRTGQLIGEVQSNPAPGTDSSYSPDGKSFLINSKKEGLSAYDSNAARRMWNISDAIKFFASANGNVQRVVVAKEDKRHEAQLYEAGKLIRIVDLQSVGTNEYIHNIAISPKGDVIAASGSKDVLVLVADNPSEIGHFRVPEELSVSSLVVGQSGFVAVGAQARRKGTESGFGKLFILGKNGNLLFQANTEHQRVNAWIPTLQFDPSGQFLLVQTLESLGLLLLG